MVLLRVAPAQMESGMARATRTGGAVVLHSILALATAALAGGCGSWDGDDDGGSAPQVATITVLPADLVLKVGETAALQVDARDAAGNPVALDPATVVYAVVQGADKLGVDGGVARGLAPGGAAVTAAAGGQVSAATPVDVILRRYLVTELGSLGGSEVRGMAINHVGQVAGHAALPGGESRAFLWTPAQPNGATGTLLDLGVLPGYSQSWAVDVNDAGQVAGNLMPAQGHDGRAFVWQAGSFLLIDDPPPGPGYAHASAINAGGQVLLLSGAPYVWTQGHWQVIGAGYSPTAWQPVDLNDSGTAVGILTFGAGAGHQFGWRDEGGRFTMRGDGLPVAINNAGVVISVYQSRPVDPVPAGINGAGHVVGRSQALRAVLVEDGATYDLNTMIPRGSGWVLDSAKAINDRGQIVAHDHGHALLLTPEP
jgi:probable HAF family extracellular repeat protein